MTTKQQTEKAQQNILIRAYKDVVGRIVKVFKNTTTHKYTISANLYDKKGQAISLISISFPNRKSCMTELKRYPRERRENLK